jgi:uncharacterized glyoxalase superfamily protein PhnB
MGVVPLQGQGTSPSLTVNDVERTMRLYTEGLGFTVVDRHEAEGRLRFVALRGGDSQISFGQDDFKKGKDRVKGVGVRFWFTTAQDLRPLAAQAKAAGLTLDQDVAPLPWGPLAFQVTDPDGYKLTIANPR